MTSERNQLVMLLATAREAKAFLLSGPAASRRSSVVEQTMTEAKKRKLNKGEGMVSVAPTRTGWRSGVVAKFLPDLPN